MIDGQIDQFFLHGMTFVIDGQGQIDQFFLHGMTFVIDGQRQIDSTTGQEC